MTGLWLSTSGGGTHEALIDRTGATTGQVPKLQGDGTLAFEDDAVGGAGGGSGAIDDTSTFDALYGSGLGYDVEFEGTGSTLPTGWSWTNQGTSTYNETMGAGVVALPVGTGVWQHRTLRRAIPSESTWTAWAKLTAWGRASGTSGGWYSGLVIGGAGTAFVSAGYDRNGGDLLRSVQWSSTAADVAVLGTPTDNAWSCFGRPYYLRISKASSTSYTVSASLDGRMWMPMLSAYDISALFTPTTLGFGGATYSDAFTDVQVACDWFRVR